MSNFLLDPMPIPVIVFLALAGLTLFLFLLNVLIGISDISQWLRMKKKEKAFLAAGITPSGSTLSHGLCIDLETGELVSDEKETLEWYRRLL
ncbi:MAG: hypothetical protein MJK11_10570 [Pseudomonadales bacterium]|nr:hypothetical protein [Pseudomonadales bacterium]